MTNLTSDWLVLNRPVTPIRLDPKPMHEFSGREPEIEPYLTDLIIARQ